MSSPPPPSSSTPSGVDACQGQLDCVVNARSGSSIITGFIINLIIGCTCLILFSILRDKLLYYNVRLFYKNVSVRPRPIPEMKWWTGGRFWKWVQICASFSEREILESAGLDALMFDHINRIGLKIFAIYTVFGVAVLIPVNLSAGAIPATAPTDGEDLTTIFARMTVSNIPDGSPLFWIHFVVIYIFLGVACYILLKEYMSYMHKRQRWMSKTLTMDIVTPIGSIEPPDHVSVRSVPESETAGGKENEMNEIGQPPPEVQGFTLSPRNIGLLRNVDESQPSVGRTRTSTTVYHDCRTAPAELLSDDKDGSESSKDLESGVKESDTSLTAITNNNNNNNNVGDEYNVQRKARKGLLRRRNSSIIFPVDEAVVKRRNSEVETIQKTTRRKLTLPSIPSRETVYGDATEMDLFAREIEEELNRQHRPEIMDLQFIRAVGKDGVDKRIVVHAHAYAILIRDVPPIIMDKSTKTFVPSRHAVDCLFKKIFPKSFMCSTSVYNTREIDYLLIRRHRLQVQLARMLVSGQGGREEEGDDACNNTPPSRHGLRFWFCWEKPSASALRKTISNIDVELRLLQRKILESPEPTTSHFVLFNSAVSAAVAAQAVLHRGNGLVWRNSPAPAPEDVNWDALWVSSKTRLLCSTLSRALAIVIILVPPVGLFTGSLAQLSFALCDEGGSLYWDWYCSDAGTFFKSVLTGWLPAVILGLWINIVVVNVLYYLSKLELSSVELSGLDRNIASWFFGYHIFNVFIGGVLGGAILSYLEIIVQDPGEVFTILGASLPIASNFFLSIVILKALALNPFRLLFPNPGILWFLLRCCGRPVGPCNRLRFDSELTWAPKSMRYGRELGLTDNIFLIGMAYACISPILLPAVFVYFLTATLVWRYQLMYVYQRCYESGGRIWHHAFTRIVLSLFCLGFFSSVVLLVKRAYVQSFIAFVTVPLGLYKFHSYCSKRFKKPAAVLGLERAVDMPPTNISPEVYNPPSLREDFQGWTPEIGKAWVGWGSPLHPY